VYVVLRIAYGRFYAPLGLSPDDLGVGYLELLTQAGGGYLVIGRPRRAARPVRSG